MGAVNTSNMIWYVMIILSWSMRYTWVQSTIAINKLEKVLK